MAPVCLQARQGGLAVLGNLPGNLQGNLAALANLAALGARRINGKSQSTFGEEENQGRCGSCGGVRRAGSAAAEAARKVR